LKPNQQATVYTLLERSTTQREIARITGIDRKTVRSYQRRWLAQANSPGVATGPEALASQTPPPWPPATAPVGAAAATSLCEPHRAFIEAQLLLKRNAVAIYQDLVDSHGFAGAYNSVKRFVATLRYSRASFRCVVWKSGQQIWAELHERAFRHFGGCPQYVVLDNLKEGVLKPDLYEPELNPVYAATLKHYGVVADPARVRDPNRKGTVEHAIGHTQATALKGKRFESIEAQNTFLASWERNWAAKRIHGTERRQVQAMFEQERPHLKALPLMGMQFFKQEQRTVCDDSCVRIEHSSYAARPAAIGSKVLVRIYAARIEIREFASGALLRTHTKAERPGTVVLPMQERVFNPSRETRHILRQAQAIGAQASRLCELMFAIEGRVGQRKLWGIVGLTKHYPAQCVETACAQALAQGVYSYTHVKELTKRAFEEAATAMQAARPPEGGAPASAAAPSVPALTQQHSLIRQADEYADLFDLATTAAAAATASAEGGQS